MTLDLRLLLTALVPLVLVACAGDDPELYKPPAEGTPATTATLRIGTVDSGFLFFGNTHISVTEIDGKKRVGNPNAPTPLAPGAHALLVRAFRDPVAAFACVRAEVAAGRTYIVQATRPEMDRTTIWLEDASTGEVVREKFSAQMIKDPVLWGPGLKALFVDPVPTSC